MTQQKGWAWQVKDYRPVEFFAARVVAEQALNSRNLQGADWAERFANYFAERAAGTEDIMPNPKFDVKIEQWELRIENESSGFSKVA